MLAQYNVIANDCYICQDKTHYMAVDLSLYFCQLHLVYIPLIRWQLHKTIQIYIPSNVLCTYGFDIVKMQLDNSITTDQVALFEEDSLHNVRSFSPDCKYPVYLNVLDTDNLKIKMFNVINDNSLVVCERTVNVQLSTVSISSPMTDPLRCFSDHMLEKIKQGLWIPIITEPLYGKLPLAVKRLIINWQVPYMNSFPTLIKLAIRTIYQYDLLTDIAIRKLPEEIREKMYEISDELKCKNESFHISTIQQ